MTFTYDLAGSGDTLNIAKVRLEIGDTVSGSGVRPDGSNLEDAEILVYLDREGDHIQRTVAAICEMLATQFANLADIAVGPRRESLSKVSERYEKRAEKLRDTYGGESQGFNAFSVGVVRVDGFSDDKPSDAVEQTGSDYEGSFQYVRPK